MKFDFELVGKIGSMALVRREDNDIDYNIFSKLGSSCVRDISGFPPALPRSDVLII